MGRWGEGNFDDDLARDYLAQVIVGQEQFVERIFAGDLPESLTCANFFDNGESYLIPAIDIMLTLHRSFGGDYLPVPRTIVTWMEEYSRRVDQLLPDVLPDAGSQEWFRTQRRPVVRKTFEDLLDCSRELYRYTADDDVQGRELGLM